MPPVVHHRIVASPQRLQDQIIFVGMVLMDQHRHPGLLGQEAQQRGQHVEAAIIEVPEVTLQHDRRIFGLGGDDHRAGHFKVADIEGGHREVVLQRVVKEQAGLRYLHEVVRFSGLL
jgi:hypothetical protein